MLGFSGCATQRVARYQHAPPVVQAIDQAVKSVDARYQLELEFAIYRAKDNASELVTAIEAMNDGRRDAMAFLIAHMPVRDLQNLSATFLINNVNLAYQARNEMPWGTDIPEDIFLNYVLPHANVNEIRDDWRSRFWNMYRDKALERQTIEATTVFLNTHAFESHGITYNIKKRAKPDQNPTETINSQVASCTGLSIMIVDILRALGIPARVVGTPLWSDKSGNHTWFEVWDAGEWHYIGAGEKGGYNEAWFTEAAGKPEMLDPRFGIYAVSYERTDTLFPTVWNPYVDDIFAVNVTRHYQVK